MNPAILKLSKLRDPLRAKLLAGFFKTGKGQYGEGDIFWGITVPKQRIVAKEFFNMSLVQVGELLKSPVHEHRLTGLLILTYKYKKLKEEKDKKKIFDFYIKNIKYINNWDLVDVTSPRIVGEYLIDKDRDILYKLANSKKLWEKRIAIVSTFSFIKQNDFKDSIKIAEILLKDRHDLIHKAVGWTLREVGKKSENTLHDFIKKHIKDMPRTTLRYSIERLPIEFKKHYMNL